jgi:hypothetical protein
MVIDDNSTLPTNLEIGSDSTLELFFLPAFDCSSRTLSATIDFEQGGIWCGSVTLSSSANVSYIDNGASWIFQPMVGRNLTLNTAGKLMPIAQIAVGAAPTSSFILGADLDFSVYTSGEARIGLFSGTLDLNDYKIYYRDFTSGISGNNQNTRAINFGSSGELICKSAHNTSINAFRQASANFSYTGTPTIRYQGTMTSGTVAIAEAAFGDFTATNAVDFYMETGSTVSFLINAGVRNFSSQGFTGTRAFAGAKIYGSLVIGSGHTPDSTTSEATMYGYDYGSGLNTITSNSRILNCELTLNLQSSTGGVALVDQLELGSTSGDGRLKILGSGTFDLNDQNIRCFEFDGDEGTAVTLNMGSGTFELFGNGLVWDTSPSTGITINGETSTILISNTTSTTASLAFGDNVTLHNIAISGGSSTGTVSFNSHTNLTLTGTLSSTRSGAAYSILFDRDQTITVADFTVSGSAGNLVTLNNDVTSVGLWTIVKSGGGVISVDYLDIQRSSASPALTWYAGANSVDSGNNTGWIFSIPPAPATATGNFLMLFN